jgi:hypothetical protein
MQDNTECFKIVARIVRRAAVKIAPLSAQPTLDHLHCLHSNHPRWTKTLLCSEQKLPDTEQLCSRTLPSGAQRGARDTITATSGAQRGARDTITTTSGAQRGVRYANHYNLPYSRRYWSFSESKLGKIEQGTQNCKTCTKSRTEIERINMNHTEKIIMQKATEIGNQ